jgi:hypothetical protein
MGTYPLKQIMTEYANGHRTAEMAVGHTLQHLEQLYEAQTAANLSRYDLRSQVDTLDTASRCCTAHRAATDDGRRVNFGGGQRSAVGRRWSVVTVGGPPSLVSRHSTPAGHSPSGVFWL